MRRFLSLVLTALLLLVTVTSVAAQPAALPAPAPTRAPSPSPATPLAGDAPAQQSQPPAPVPANLTMAAGTWYIGAMPPNYDPSKPVLLFVHGKGGSASSWWTDTTYHGTNDMYSYAYYNGYRTAFVDLHPEGHMWANGELLNRLMAQITSYFGVSRVTIIAHSKGGVDSNAASVHYGAAGKIQKVITLGTPHRGTPLADLAYSSWTWWLAELLGQTGDATYVMQTGYMDYFRSITDGRDPGVAYATLSGYKCGPVFTALWMGCMAIGGEDDGVVPVWSAQKPGGVHLRTGYWDHDEIRMGSRVWSYLAPQLTATGITREGRVASPGAALERKVPGNLILRGGEVSGQAEGTAFPLETGVASASFLFYASSPDFTATLVGPDGSQHLVSMTEQARTGEAFAGAWVGVVEVERPATGSWSLQVDSPQRAGYLMVAALESKLQATLDRGIGTAGLGGRRDLAVTLSGRPKVEASEAWGEISLTGVDRSAIGLMGAPMAVPFTTVRGGHRATLELPQQAGVHNLTVTVTGSLEDGSLFERTLVTSLAVLNQDGTGIPLAP